MKDRYSFLLVILAGVFVTCLLVANVIAGKLWAAPFGVILTAGVFCFPVVYIIGDVVPEVYGLATARKVILLGFACNLLAVIFFLLTLAAAYPPFWTGQDAFQTVLGFTPRLLVASFAGYLIGTNANAWTLVRVKRLTNSRWLWMRTISSTIVGEALDSLVFIVVAFGLSMPWNVITGMVVAQATFKILYEVIATPLTYWVVARVKRYEGVEV